MSELLWTISQDKQLLLIILLIILGITNMLFVNEKLKVKHISKKTMETIYNIEIDKAQNAMTSDEKKYHLNRASGMMELYTHMGFEPKIYENDHIEL